MKDCDAKLPRECEPRLSEALERLVQLYDAWGKPDEADEWRKKQEESKSVPRSIQQR